MYLIDLSNRQKKGYVFMRDSRESKHVSTLPCPCKNIKGSQERAPEEREKEAVGIRKQRQREENVERFDLPTRPYKLLLRSLSVSLSFSLELGCLLIPFGLCFTVLSSVEGRDILITLGFGVYLRLCHLILAFTFLSLSL